MRAPSGVSPLVRNAALLLPLILLLTALAQAHAQTRRALIVGINHYATGGRSDRTQDLDGAVNDAEAIAATLGAYHGFVSKEVLILKDQQATRARILQEIQAHLIKQAQPGDISLFFFAGHGSWIENPNSAETDHRDETIVPADSNRGVPDIRDKELARLFNQVLERRASLIAIFDSCHSGSIARGLPGDDKIRFAPPAQSGARAVVENEMGPLPEERGALILSAAQDQQPAQERRVHGQPRGRFSYALQQALISAPPDLSAENLFLRVKALMQAGGSMQEPVLAATTARRRQTLLGDAARAASGHGVVAVGRVTGAAVLLQAGFAVGLSKLAELRRLHGEDRVRLRITEVTGMSTSKAEVVDGAIDSLKPGDLFEIERYGTPPLENLRVYLPPDAPPRERLQSALRAVAALRTAAVLDWVADPTEQAPTHILSWRGGGWVLRDRQKTLLQLGAQLSAKQVLLRLRHLDTRPRLFLFLPPPQELLRALQLGAGSDNNIVDTTHRPEEADYQLVGRMAANQMEYCWLLPEAAAGASVLPARSRWTGGAAAALATQLTDDALRLNRLKVWHNLEGTPGTGRFPYRLALRNMQTKGLLVPRAPMRGGEQYQLVLVAQGQPQRVQPRYVYVFNLNAEGQSTLLVPRLGAGNVENLVPDARDRQTLPPNVIPVGAGFRVDPPFGSDTLILITSMTAIPNPDVLAFDGVRSRASLPASAHPLELLLRAAGANQRGITTSAPQDWSIERLVVQSIEK